MQGEKLEETLQHLSSETLDNLRRVGGTREGKGIGLLCRGRIYYSSFVGKFEDAIIGYVIDYQSSASDLAVQASN